MFVCSVSSVLAVQSDSNVDVFKPPVLVGEVKPVYPRSTLVTQQEGWVRISMLVTEQGEVVDPVIIDTSGKKAFERAALAAAKKWKFQPATKNGPAVKQCIIKKFQFLIEDAEQSITKKFRRKATKIIDLIEDKNFNEAKDMLYELSNQSLWNLTEDAWHKYLLAKFYAATQQTAMQLRYLRKTVEYDTTHLPVSIYLEALAALYNLEVAAENYPSALYLASKAEQYVSKHKFAKAVVNHSKKMKDYIEYKQAISVNAEIGKRGYWFGQLLRKRLAFDHIAGNIKRVELRCGNKRQSFDFKQGWVWDIPDGWGHCTALVFGDQGTKFKLIEYLKTKT